jgi:hypothetical protein
MSMADERTPNPATSYPERMEPVAAILAALIPGAGHVFLGENRRGIMICVGVLGLFVSGIFIGGIDVIDSKSDRLWFIGQALVGPTAFVVDGMHQRAKVPDATVPGGRRAPNPGANPAYGTSLAKMNELGTLFATIAGMLNLIAILDAGFHSRPRGADGGSA